MTDDDPTISIEPDPPQAGKDCKVHYTGPLPIELEIDWVPDSVTEPSTVTILGAPHSWGEFTIPAGATGILIHDPTGAAPDLSRVVV